MTEARVCPACGEAPVGPETHVCKAPTDGSQPARPGYGERFAGRYVLLERLGAGGSGVVHRAYDTVLDAHVALKILGAGPVDDLLRARLKREIRIGRDLDHPNVSRVFDVGESDGTAFATLRLVDGESLQSRVARAPLDRAARVRLAKGLVAGLAAAHRLGIVHRDVKPANVLVSEAGEPVLLDFGVATDTGTTPSAEERRGDRITLDGEAPGTPAYMAPEQLRGEAASPASDLWSLALTVSFAATGKVGRPVDPGAFRALGGRVSALLRRCLEEDPARRPRDATELEEAFAGTSRATWLAAFGVAVAVAVAAVVGRSSPAPAPRVPLVSIDRFENRTGDPALDWLEHGVADLVSSSLEASDAVRLALDPADRRRAVRIGGRIEGGTEPTLALELRAPGGRRLASARVRDPAGDGLFDGLDAALGAFVTKLGGRLEGTRVGTRRLTRDPRAFAAWARAQDLARMSRTDDALEALREATRIDPGFAQAQLQRSFLMGSGIFGTLAEAQTALDLARRHADRLPEADRRLVEALVEARATGANHAALGRVRAALRSRPPDPAAYRMAARMDDTDAAFRRAVLEEWANRLPADPAPHNLLGYLFARELRDAASAERELLAYLELSKGEPNAHDSYGDFLREAGRLDEAEREYRRAMEIDPRFQPSAGDLVAVAILKDDLALADARLLEWRPIFPPTSSRVGGWMAAYAAVSLTRGDLAEALRRVEDAMRDTALGSRGWHVREVEAIARALHGDLGGARTATAEADRLHRLLHGAHGGLPSLRPYVDGIACHRRRDAACLDAAKDALRALAADPASGDRMLRGRARVVEGLSTALSGDPSGAAERLRLSPQAEGSGGPLFLAARERARALSDAGRLGEADQAYAEAATLRSWYALVVTAEGSVEWRGLLEEWASVARRLGDPARAAALDARRRALR